MNRFKAFSITGILLFLISLSPIPSAAIRTEECLMCHSDPDFSVKKGKEIIPLFVDETSYHNSVHGQIECIACHTDAGVKALPHPENLSPVSCAACHEETRQIYDNSLHGKALRQGDTYAPQCKDCHGTHNILSKNNPDSNTFKMNIPALCGKCHREDSRVVKTHKIEEEKVFENYSMSIHGKGLFKRGLIVTAVCTDCHGFHNILPHEDPDSSINAKNISKTCLKCHSLIEKVHKKIIRGELWEKKPHVIPICIDCHSPHEIRRIYYSEGLSDKDCLTCHGKKKLTIIKIDKERSLFVDKKIILKSAHAKEKCIKCHTDVSITRYPPCEKTTPVDCSICHAKESESYHRSYHGELHDRGNQVAPGCTDCHGSHNTLKKNNPESPIFTTNIPALCGDCHREGAKAANRYKGAEKQILKSYIMSIHGKGLKKSGLLNTAVCTSCHTAHDIYPVSDPRSSVNKNNIPKTCSKCHRGIFEIFTKSVHSPGVTKTSDPLPVCNNCHTAHQIVRVDKAGFRQDVSSHCGNCHRDLADTYYMTYHGKVSKLGYLKAAKCYDCHGSHDILRTTDPESRLSRKNIVKTCQKCHSGSNRRFAGYLTHATHHNRLRYPILFYTFWSMMLLLIGTFIFFGIHTLLWLPRSFAEMRKRKKTKAGEEPRQYLRFDPFHRIMHLFVILSFFGLAITGMILKFSYMKWAVVTSRIMGGFEVTGFIHRLGAIITFGYFIIHIGFLIRKIRNKETSIREIFFGKNTLLPTIEDLHDFIATFKWFIGLGPRPTYGRWTYWEKFDYFAVFWGVAIIGASGLILWFPEFFTLFLPGWIINVVTIIHSDEALLAVGFIFTIHFFNTHFRPEKFPMDPVIFTGRVPLSEFKEDRSREYEILVKENKLKRYLVGPAPRRLFLASRIFGLTCLTIGIILILLIIYSMLFGYR